MADEDTKQESPWGIDRLKKIQKGISEEQQKALQSECALYAKCFGTDAGRKVLKLITEALDRQPVWDPNLDPKFGYFREGQNDVIKNITNRINFARSK